MQVDLDEAIFWYLAAIEESYTVKTDIILCKNQSGAFGFQWIRFSTKTTDMFCVFV